MNNSSVHVSSNAANQPVSGLQALIGQIWQQVQRWWELAEQRRKLALLDEDALQDLGLSRAEVLSESQRSFWDDPMASHTASTRPSA
jgi:uncharacterized protein YjiS (DUF1127 family)